jgi:hypothetical protein
MNQKPCSPISTFLAESPDSPSQPSSLEEYEQLSLLKLIPTHSLSSDITSQESPFTATSETITPDGDNSTLLPADFPARERVMQELEPDFLTQNQLSGEKEFAVLSKLDPDSVLLNNLKELSDEDFELFLADSTWQDTQQKLSLSRRVALEPDTRDSDCLLFPTLTSNECSTSRPAGQTKCERWFKDKGLVPPGYQLGREAIALMMGFPSDWFEVLSQKNSNQTTTSSLPTPQDASEPDISQEEPLPQDKQPLPSVESSISIPCLVKQPGRDELKGVIQKDLGDCFVVYIPSSDSTVTVSKLFVYPDFSERVGQTDKCSSKITPPSTNCSSKTRRQNGEGSGHIYYRTVTRNGKEYRQAYYQWRENGKQRTKYISKKLLDKVEEAESRKLPVADILNLLGEKNKCSSKSSITCPDGIECSSKIESPSKTQRTRGEGSGSIHCKPIKRSGKEYKQYWYHYEFWREGDRITKKSKYIPNHRRSQIEKMNSEKAPIEDILKVLNNRSKREK